MTWPQLLALQRRLAEWIEPWKCEGTEVFVVVEDCEEVQRKHLAWFSSEKLAMLVCDLHNVGMFLINALLMRQRGEDDRRQSVNAPETRRKEK